MICTCLCHRDDVFCFDAIPCCEYCGEKYINSDGTLKYDPRIKNLIKTKEINIEDGIFIEGTPLKYTHKKLKLLKRI